MIFVVKKTEQMPPYREIEKEIIDLLEKAKLILKNEENNNQVVMHTKGSLPTRDNELLLKDIEKFVDSIGGGERLGNLCESLPVATYMFEAIVDHDKHTLYEKQCETYDITNGFVLLGANIMVPDYDGEL